MHIRFKAQNKVSVKYSAWHYGLLFIFKNYLRGNNF